MAEPNTDQSSMARLRRWWWRHVRRVRGEICRRCGQPVALTCPTYWFAPNALWNEVEGGEGGIRCIPCFTRDCDEQGIVVAWTTTEEWRRDLRRGRVSAVAPREEQDGR